MLKLVIVTINNNVINQIFFFIHFNHFTNVPNFLGSVSHSLLQCFTCGEKKMCAPAGGHSNRIAWLLLWLVMVKLSW